MIVVWPGIDLSNDKWEKRLIEDFRRANLRSLHNLSYAIAVNSEHLTLILAGKAYDHYLL